MPSFDTKWSRRRLLSSTGAIIGGASFRSAHTNNAQASAAGQNWNGTPFGNGLLHGRVAVITGAARGIGRAIAVDMAANGATIVLIGEVEAVPNPPRNPSEEEAAKVRALTFHCVCPG